MAVNEIMYLILARELGFEPRQHGFKAQHSTIKLLPNIYLI